MEQYIKKSALVAEIERRISDNKKDIERASHKNLEDYFEGYEDALVLLKEKFIDTFEVKEVEEEPVSEEWIEELTTKLDSMSKEDFKRVFDKYAVDFNEEPVSEELEEAAIEYCGGNKGSDARVRGGFLAGAKWQKEQFEKDYTNLCNGIATAKGLAVAMAYNKGVADAKEQLMANAVDVTVHIDAGGYPYIPQMELYDYDNDVPLAKEGDKYKVVLIKEE